MASNAVIVASAGTGKTTYLVGLIDIASQRRTLITTYTNENLGQIRACLFDRFGVVPKGVEAITWYSFLISHGIRPYYNLVSSAALHRNPALLDIPPGIARRIPKSDVDAYYFSPGGHLYRDRVSELVCLINDKTGGKVVSRLAGIFQAVLIDEFQDLNGYDLHLLERLFHSIIPVVAVGDPRQGTFTTNRSAKGRGFKGANIVDWLNTPAISKLVSIEERTDTWRSNQVICDFADGLYPHLPKSTSKNLIPTGHDGIFEIAPENVLGYFEQHAPVVLRWNKTANTMGLPAVNIGISKGRTFDRVLIFPTANMKTYLKTRDVSKAGDIAKFYVAITRARHSVAFVV